MNIVILNWQRSLWEGDEEVVKKSGRHKSMRVVTHICMEKTQGIFLYRYPHLKLTKHHVLLQENWRTRG
jgi:hypothetical protein